MSSSVGDEFSYDSQADEYIKKTLPQYSVILIDIQKGGCAAWFKTEYFIYISGFDNDTVTCHLSRFKKKNNNNNN